MTEVIATVVESFARHAPAACHLVIKNHPLDMGLVNYAQQIATLASRCGVAGRVHYVETGDLALLLRKARGMVTVNSSAGSLALSLGCPTFALSHAIYALPGLTASEDLAGFWSAPQPPDRLLFRAFRNTVIHATQVNGGFYCPAGIGLAVENTWRRLVAKRSPLEELV
jgi:capsular polysaccharide export protein